MSELFSKIKEVTEISAISGHEAPVRDYLREKMKASSRTVKSFLLDQTVLAGLGNIYVDEALFLAGIIVIVVGVSFLFSTPLITVLGLGAGLFLLGFALLCGILFIWICTKILPPVIRGIVKVCSLPFRRKN